MRSSFEKRLLENPASVPNSIMPVYEHFASDIRRGAAARAFKPNGLSTRLMVGGCRPLFFHWVCAPSWGGFLPGLSRKKSGAEKLPKDSFGLFLWSVSVSAPVAGSALCSAETLPGPEARTALLCEGFAARGSASQKRWSSLAGAYRGRCNPPKYFRVSRRSGHGQASFPLGCCFRKSHRRPDLCTRSGFALQLRCAGVCSRRKLTPVGQWPGQRFLQNGLAHQVSAADVFNRRTLADVCRHEAIHTAAPFRMVLVRAYRAAAIGRTRWQRLGWIPNLCPVSIGCG